MGDLAAQAAKRNVTLCDEACPWATRAAALFSPLRRRVQQALDRRVNRARYDADRTIAVFAARLSGATDLDVLQADLAGVGRQALEPAQVWVWLSEPG